MPNRMTQRSIGSQSSFATPDSTNSMADWQMRTKRPLREPVREEPGPSFKNYITPAGLQRLKDEHRFLLNRERPAVVQVVARAASNGDRSENADYLYGKRRLRQIDRSEEHTSELQSLTNLVC